MHEKYLGDSYDIVKRYWAERLKNVAPLFAHPGFVSPGLRPGFEAITTIPVLQPNEAKEEPFGLFLDPHTGIPLPTASSQTMTPSHAPLSFIEAQFRRLGPLYLICYDQSHDRHSSLTRGEQRALKRTVLKAASIWSFYYVSHAPFLFAATDMEVLDRVLNRLVACGIPRSRFEAPPVEL